MRLRVLQRHPVSAGTPKGLRVRRKGTELAVSPRAEEVLLLLREADEREPGRLEQARDAANNRGRAMPVRTIRKGRALLDRAAWRGVELPAPLGEALAKGAGHKYLRRIPTGNPKRPWRYIYGVTGATGHHGQDDDHFDIGAKFRVTHAGKAGHFEVVARQGGKVKVRHDETGHQAMVTVQALRAMLRREHAELVGAHRTRLQRDIAAAREHGTKRQVERLLDEARRHGHQDLAGGHGPSQNDKRGTTVTVRGATWRRGKGDLWHRADHKRSAPTATLQAWWKAERAEAEQATAQADGLSDAQQRQREEAARRSAARRRTAPDADTPGLVHTEVGTHVGRSRADVATPTGPTGAANADDVHALTKADLLTKPDPAAAQAAGRSAGAHHLHRALVRLVGKSPFAGRSRRWQSQANLREARLRTVAKSAAQAFRDGCVYLDKALAGCKTAKDVHELVGELRELRISESLDSVVFPLVDGKLPSGSRPFSGPPEKIEVKRRVAEQLGLRMDEVGISGFRHVYDPAEMAAWRKAPPGPGRRRPEPTGLQFVVRNIPRSRAHEVMFDALGEQFSKLSQGQPSDGVRKAFAEAKALDEKGWAAANEETRRKGAARRFRWADVRGEAYDRVGGQAVARADGPQMAADFGLKNIQYGKWMSQSDREHHLKAAHGALFDLADVLGVDHGTVSLSGRLAVAFGGRGKGRAAAHYESDLKIINLTKFAGGGSLAHEWGHFLDNVLAQAHGGGGDGFASEGAGALPGPVQAALDDLNSAMFGTAATRRTELSRLVGEHNRLVEAHNAGDTDSARAAKRLRREIQWARRRLEAADTTQFARDAEALGAKYWGSTPEMFARGFEAYVNDRLTAGGRKNSYLVHGVVGHHPTMVAARRSPKVIRAEREAAQGRAAQHPEVKAARAAADDAQARAERAAVKAHDRVMAAHRAKHGRRKLAEQKRWLAVNRDPEYSAARSASASASRAHRALLDKHTDEVAEHHDGTEHPVQAQPYPQGEERARINAAFERLVGALRQTGALKKALENAHDLLKAAGEAAHPLGPAPARNRKQHPFEGTIRWPGLPLIRVENAVGSVREGVGPRGAWRTEMKAHYGEFAGTEGVDGDPIDVFVGPNRHAPYAYVVHQQRPDSGAYDEDKVMLGFDTRADAEAMFRAHYNRPGFVQSVRRLSLPELADWLVEHGKAGKTIDGGRELS